MRCSSRWAGRAGFGRWPALAVFGWLLWLPAFALWAESAEDVYRRGVEAEDRGDHAEVAAAMREALALRPAAGGPMVKIYGMRFEDFTPSFRLGRALAELGDCRSALEAWRQADQEPLRAEQRRQLASARERCARALPPPASGPVDAGPLTSERAIEIPPPPATASASNEPLGKPEPPAWLRLAAAELLRGRYRRTVELLADLDRATSRERSTALILRSAAHFALSREKPERDQQALNRARADAQACRRLEPALEPSSFYFSPAFRSFFAKVEP